MLNPAEHEILNADKYKNIKKFSFFSGSYKPRMLFFLLTNLKMPTIVGILTITSKKSFILLGANLSALYLECCLYICIIELYAKKDYFNFPMADFPFLSSNIPLAPACGVCVVSYC